MRIFSNSIGEGSGIGKGNGYSQCNGYGYGQCVFQIFLQDTHMRLTMDAFCFVLK